MANGKQNLFPGVDLFKLIGAVIVVAIHSHPFENIPLPMWADFVYKLICNTAVPFFFIASGFLLGYKSLNEERIFKKLKSFVWMYVIALLCYFPLDILIGWADNPSVGRLFVSYIKRIFIIGGTNTSYHLWYVLSVCYSLLLFFIIWKLVSPRKRDIVIAIASVMLFLVAIIIDWLLAKEHDIAAFNELSALVARFTHTGRVLTGPFYMWIGLLFARKFPSRPSLSFCLLLLIAGVIYQAIGFQLQIPNVMFYIGVFALASHIIRLPFETYWCRRASSSIYFVHMVPISIFFYLVLKLPLGMELFMISMLSSVIVSVFWIPFNKNVLSKWK